MELDVTQKCGAECICEGPGKCPCYGVLMNGNLHAKCKNSQNWRDNFSSFFDSLATEEVRKYNEERDKAAMEEINKQIRIRREEEKDIDDAIAEISLKAENVNGQMDGLGDYVEKVLTKFGVTQERVQKALGTTDCGCDKRKQFLNQLFPFARKNDEPKKEDST